MKKLITVLAIGGGLRHAEAMMLSLDHFQKVPDGFFLKFKRVKMRNKSKRRDKEWSEMHIPYKLKDTDFSPGLLLEEYLEDMWRILGKSSGRVFWTGKDHTYINQPMGKNAVSRIPKEIAKHLNLPNPERFVFHSFRRTAATFASEAGMSENELCDFFSWLNSSMAREYTSSTKRSARVMGGVLLGGNNKFDSAPGLTGPGAAPGALSGPGAAPGALSGPGAAPGALSGPGAAPGALSGPGAAPGALSGPGADSGSISEPAGLSGPGPAAPGFSGAGPAAPGFFGAPPTAPGFSGAPPTAPGFFGAGPTAPGSVGALAPYAAYHGWGVPPYPPYSYGGQFYPYGMAPAAPWAPTAAGGGGHSLPPPAKVQRVQEDKELMNDSLDEFAAELDKLEEQQGGQKGEQQGIMIKTEGKKQAMSSIASSGLKELIKKDTKIEKFVFNVYHNVDTVNN